MPGEILTKSTLPEAKEELRNIYKAKSLSFQECSKEQYEALDHDEREDSDNHINEENLGKASEIIDLAYYKYLPDRKTAYHILLKHKNGENLEDYFILTPDLS